MTRKLMLNPNDVKVMLGELVNEWLNNSAVVRPSNYNAKSKHACLVTQGAGRNRKMSRVIIGVPPEKYIGWVRFKL